MPLITLGFLSRHERNKHFQRHREDFNFADELEYEAAADKFMGDPLPAGILERVIPAGRDKAGRVLRYDPATNTFGTMSADRHLLTMFKPKVTPWTASGLEYFNRQR